MTPTADQSIGRVVRRRGRRDERRDERRHVLPAPELPFRVEYLTAFYARVEPLVAAVGEERARAALGGSSCSDAPWAVGVSASAARNPRSGGERASGRGAIDRSGGCGRRAGSGET